MRRLAIPVLMPLMAVLSLVVPAQARITWCKTDPIVLLNGVPVQLLISIPDEYLSLVNGPIRIEMRTSASVQREVVFTDAGFNGYGEEVVFTDLPGRPSQSGRVSAQIRVQVPIDKLQLGDRAQVPVQVVLIAGDARPKYVTGTSDLTALAFSVADNVDSTVTDR